MAYSENLLGLHQWHPSSITDSLFSDVFTLLETETLTKSLQQSFFSTNTYSQTLTDNTNSTNSFTANSFIEKPTYSGGGSDQETTSKPRNSISINNGKIMKRKSRKRSSSSITYITANSTNFREVVQKVTGISTGNELLPVTSVLKQQGKKQSHDLLSNYSNLPTLDTSEILLDQKQRPQISVAPKMGLTSKGHLVVGGSGFGLDFDSFPTLESWGVK